MAWKFTYPGEVLSTALSDEQSQALRDGIDESPPQGSGWLRFDDSDGYTRRVPVTPGVGVLFEQVGVPSGNCG
jgi:hypothetical protein